MKRLAPLPLLALGALLLAAVMAPAAQYELTSSVIAGGGGTSTGGTYSVSGTIGQPAVAAGPMTGGNYALSGGFWSMDIAVQTPGSPVLTIERTNNSVIISWPAASTGFTLEVSGNIASPLAWGNSGAAPVVLNSRYTVTLPMQPGARFYRLRAP